MANKMKLIIDTDPGVDDAMALGIALTWPNAEILAVTGVHGNISCEQACKNVLKILKVFGREDVLVYKGADSPIFGNYLVLIFERKSFATFVQFEDLMCSVLSIDT